jgi:hypothetical protein
MPLCNYRWLAEAMSCIYSECGSLKLTNQHAKRFPNIAFYVFHVWPYYILHSI